MIAADGQAKPVVIVRVPATSANVGVGFDCLGIALDLTATFLMTPAEELSIDGCEERFRGADNLVWQSYLQACKELGHEARPLHITILSPIPLSGGLGSSSTCVIAGVACAQALAGGYDAEECLEVSTRIEGHPDNVAPAIMGGLVSSFIEGDITTSTRMDVASNLRFIAIAPPYEVRTADARRVLPKEVPASTAVWQMGRCVATVPDYDALKAAALAAGACAFMISGSGSTMLAVADGDEVASHVADALAKTCPGYWLRTLPANSLGTTVDLN